MDGWIIGWMDRRWLDGRDEWTESMDGWTRW